MIVVACSEFLYTLIQICRHVGPLTDKTIADFFLPVISFLSYRLAGLEAIGESFCTSGWWVLINLDKRCKNTSISSRYTYYKVVFMSKVWIYLPPILQNVGSSKLKKKVSFWGWKKLVSQGVENSFVQNILALFYLISGIAFKKYFFPQLTTSIHCGD